MDQKEPKLKVPIGWKTAEASGTDAVRSLFIIALTYRLAWPFAILVSLAAGWLSIGEVESLKPIFLGD